MTQEQVYHNTKAVASACPCGLHPQRLTEEGQRMMEEQLLQRGYERMPSGEAFIRHPRANG